MIKAPLPEVPTESSPMELPLSVPSAVRMATLLLILAGVFDIVRAGTYVVGSLQSFHMIRGEEFRGLLRSCGVLGWAFILSYGLKRGEKWAWTAAIVSSVFYVLRNARELRAFLQMRAKGYADTEFQICLLMCLCATLIIVVLYLLSRNGRAPFRNQS